MITERYNQVKEGIAEACRRCGRDPEEVLLLAVSKTKPAEMIRELYDAGVRDFGENRVQELTAKYEELPKDIRWHQIGHLQQNKVKYIAGKTALIHSLESLRLAETIQKESEKRNVLSDVLVEVNVAEEESKFGIRAEETESFIREVSAFPNLRVKGLMTIAPFVADPEENRLVFRTLRTLSVDIAAKNINNVSMGILSMGMTNDYEVAVEEGSTIVRVGTAIFGER